MADKQDRKPVTRKSYHSTLRTFCKWLVGGGVIPIDPTTGVRLERVPARNPLCLSPADVEKVVVAVESESRHNPAAAPGCSQWLVPIMRFNIYAGLRSGELVNLEWDDVDLNRRLLHVRNRDGFNTKSHRDRVLPLCTPAAEVLRELVPRCRFVFPSHTGRRLGRQYLSRRTKHFLRKAGFADMCFHSFRHSAASLLINNGASIEATRRYLGHSSIQVTQRYLSVGPAMFRSQIEQALTAAAANAQAPSIRPDVRDCQCASHRGSDLPVAVACGQKRMMAVIRQNGSRGFVPAHGTPPTNEL